ncbi:hypothetical protein SKAU_G00162230 [Synaphobranchus kaupii]|uniref:Uncharacterized protein n=1 Tax=Synaphobranchus kaupii TaxID=118154 RepID=A0A9Q1FIX6_SYNKA|nr:hypothetical protein SKAU_G00162230 [Synaphobranchus kaupii]
MKPVFNNVCFTAPAPLLKPAIVIGLTARPAPPPTPGYLISRWSGRKERPAAFFSLASHYLCPGLPPPLTAPSAHSKTWVNLPIVLLWGVLVHPCGYNSSFLTNPQSVPRPWARTLRQINRTGPEEAGSPNPDGSTKGGDDVAVDPVVGLALLGHGGRESLRAIPSVFALFPSQPGGGYSATHWLTAPPRLPAPRGSIPDGPDCTRSRSASERQPQTVTPRPRPPKHPLAAPPGLRLQ